MNPNVALADILALIADWDSTPFDGPMAEGLVQDLVDRIDGLHGWLASGGFLPEAWAHARPMTERPTRTRGPIRHLDGTLSEWSDF